MLCLSGLRARQGLKDIVSQDKLRRLPACLPSKAGRAYTAFLFYLSENSQEFKSSVSQDKLRRLKLGTNEYGTVTVT
jgi:hypothetical protein